MPSIVFRILVSSLFGLFWLGMGFAHGDVVCTDEDFRKLALENYGPLLDEPIQTIPIYIANGTRRFAFQGTALELKFIEAALLAPHPKKTKTAYQKAYSRTKKRALVREFVARLLEAYGLREVDPSEWYLRALGIFKKSGYAMSFKQDSEHPSEEMFWDIEDLRKFDAILSRQPKELLFLNDHLGRRNKGFQKMAKTSKAMLMPGSTTKYACGYSTNPIEIREDCVSALVVTHELVHRLVYSSVGGVQKYNLLFNGQAFKKPFEEDTNYFSTYAKTNFAENLAESLAGFIVDPEEVRLNIPVKHGLLFSQMLPTEYSNYGRWGDGEWLFQTIVEKGLDLITRVDYLEDGKIFVDSNAGFTSTWKEVGGAILAATKVIESTVLEFYNRLTISQLRISESFCAQGGSEGLMADIWIGADGLFAGLVKPFQEKASEIAPDKLTSANLPKVSDVEKAIDAIESSYGYKVRDRMLVKKELRRIHLDSTAH